MKFEDRRRGICATICRRGRFRGHGILLPFLAAAPNPAFAPDPVVRRIHHARQRNATFAHLPT